MKKKLNVLWKGNNPKRKNIKGKGYTACLHFIPGQHISIPDEALKSLKDEVLTGQLIICNEIEEDKKKKDKKKKVTTESSITDSKKEGQ